MSDRDRRLRDYLKERVRAGAKFCRIHLTELDEDLCLPCGFGLPAPSMDKRNEFSAALDTLGRER